MKKLPLANAKSNLNNIRAFQENEHINEKKIILTFFEPSQILTIQILSFLKN